MTSLPPPLSERDGAVVRLVARFRQLTSQHVSCVLFADATAMPVHRSPRRLVAMGYLTRFPRVFGDGGSHGWVYQLGRTGWSFAERAGTFKKVESVPCIKLPVCRGDDSAWHDRTRR